MRLHNRQIKATFWNDSDLAQWPRDKRWFYEGLIQLADDSGCLEDSTFAFKLNLFPSPVDADITVDVLDEWKSELLSETKLVAYVVSGKKCLYLTNFHKHQVLKNPERPETPLPTWIEWTPYPSNPRTGKYTVSDEFLTEFLHSSYSSLTNVFQREVEEKRTRSEEKEKTTKDSMIPTAYEEVAAAIEKTNESSSPSSLDSELAQLGKIYETEGFGQISGMIAEHLKILLDTFGFEWVSEAIREAVLQNKRRLKYVKGVLENWRSEGGIRRTEPVVTNGRSRAGPPDQDARYKDFYSLFPDM